MKCKHCKFYMDVEVPHCRRLPPMRENEGKNAGFPIVNREWFCGEHKLSLIKLLFSKKRKAPDVQNTPSEP